MFWRLSVFEDQYIVMQLPRRLLRVRGGYLGQYFFSVSQMTQSPPAFDWLRIEINPPENLAEAIMMRMMNPPAPNEGMLRTEHIRNGITSLRTGGCECVTTCTSLLDGISEYRWDLFFDKRELPLYVSVFRQGDFQTDEPNWIRVIESIRLKKPITWEMIEKSYDEMSLDTGSGEQSRQPSTSFAEMKDSFLKKGALLRKALNGGATDGEIRHWEDQLGIEFPEALRFLYSCGDGQASGRVALFSKGYEFLSLSRVSELYGTLKKVYEEYEGMWQGEEPNVGVVKDVWWIPGWIPFASTLTGDCLCIDLDPGPEGRVGQVIEFIHDDTKRNLVAFSVGDFVMRELEALEESG